MTVLSAAGLAKRFGSVSALAGIDLELEEGGIYGVVGPNGAGKTTLFAVLSGFVKPDCGSIRLHGRDVLRLKPHERAQLGLARTFQLVRPLSGMTPRQTLELAWWGCRSRHKELSPAGRRAAGDDLLDRIGLKSRGDDCVDELNPGELRLLDVARSLATHPDLLLLDEPFAGLSIPEIRVLTQLVLEQRDAGKTVVIIEHRLRELMALVDQVVVMNFGSRLASGTPREVVANEAVIEAYLGRDSNVLSHA